MIRIIKITIAVIALLLIIIGIYMMINGSLEMYPTIEQQEKIPSSESVQDGADDSSINSEEYADEIVDDTKEESTNEQEYSVEASDDEVTKGEDSTYCISEVSQEEDVSASDDKFEAFFDLGDKDTVDATEIVDGYSESNLNGKMTVTKKSIKEGFTEYEFSENGEQCLSVENANEMLWQNMDYIQYKDINDDGKDEILVAFYTHGTSSYSVCEFYVYGQIDDEWKKMMSYCAEDSDDNISALLNDSEYAGKTVADVCLTDNGLLLSIDDGEKIDGVYYPKGYKLLIN